MLAVQQFKPGRTCKVYPLLAILLKREGYFIMLYKIKYGCILQSNNKTKKTNRWIQCDKK